MKGQNTIGILEIERDASNSDLTADDYKQMLWSHLVVSRKHRKVINKVARQLNVYPHPPNVYEAICNYLFSNIAI